MSKAEKRVRVTNTVEIGAECIVPETTQLGENVRIGDRVVFAGSDIAVGAGSTIEAGAVIGGGVKIGQGALIRAGSVVLRPVPPNAIVEGNPAQVVGYLELQNNAGPRSREVIDASAFTGMNTPASIPLPVKGNKLLLMRRVSDARGSLTVGEVRKELPFTPERYFVVFDVPSSELRGEHAHKVCQQFLVCIHGSCRVLLDDGTNRCEVTLDRPDLGIFMPPMTWGTQYKYNPDTVLLVFASHTYDTNDYLRTYDEFLSELEKLK